MYPTLQAYFPDATWIQIGWGDYQYYGNPEQTKWMGVKALFTPTAAIMGILGVNAIPEDIPKKRKLYEIPLDTGHWNAVLAFVCGYLKLDDANQMTEVRVKGNGEVFFEAHGTYTIFNSCNHWTARALETAGLTMKPRRSFSPNYVEHMRQRLMALRRSLDDSKHAEPCTYVVRADGSLYQYRQA